MTGLTKRVTCGTGQRRSKANKNVNLIAVSGGDKMKFEFRYATEQDAALILYFIKELAVYEKMLDEVVATDELLREWIF